MLRLAQEPVHAERARPAERQLTEQPDAEREPVGSTGMKRSASAAEAEVIAAVAAAVDRVLAGQRELTQRAVSLLETERQQFDAERQRAGARG